MELSAQHTPVLIIGAGPSGLMMAAQLLRYGVQPVIVDSRKGPTNHTKALAVQARSLEIYRQMGLSDTVVKGGSQTQGLHFYYENDLKATYPAGDAGAGLTPFPYVLMYPQSKNERVLLGNLTKNAVPVYWNTTLQSIKQTGKTVEAVLQSGESTVTITADWLIGADGAHSTVRKQLNIPFHGDTYAHLFYLADVITNTDGDFIDLHMAANGLAGFFPTDDKNGWRIIGNIPDKLIEKKDLVLEDIRPSLEAILHGLVTIKECKWFTTYKLHHRMADAFRQGRCFLIGDAAHIHSPVGGQGMNTGLQDAYNLAWKLAGVINGKIRDRTLDTYAAERMPVARALLKTTDKAFTIAMSRNWLLRLAKKWLLPKAFSMMWRNAKVKQEFFKRIAQIGIEYRHSAINLHLSQGSYIKAGDRLPYLKLYDEKKQTETDLHAWCSKPGSTLIIMGQVAEHELLNYARWITHFYGQGLNFFYLPQSKNNQHIFNAFEVKPGHNKTLIIRPDNYIGFMCDSAEIDVINNYLENTLGLIRTK